MAVEEYFGIDLIYERKKAKVRPNAIAERMGVSRQRLNNVERDVDGIVTAVFYGRYMAAVEAEVAERKRLKAEAEAKNGVASGPAPAVTGRRTVT